MARKKIIKIIDNIMAFILSALVFAFFFDLSIRCDYNRFCSIFLALWGLACFYIIIFALTIVAWRIFTPEGREEEQTARAIQEIKRLEKKRAREWKRLNKF